MAKVCGEMKHVTLCSTLVWCHIQSIKNRISNEFVTVNSRTGKKIKQNEKPSKNKNQFQNIFVRQNIVNAIRLMPLKKFLTTVCFNCLLIDINWSQRWMKILTVGTQLKSEREEKKSTEQTIIWSRFSNNNKTVKKKQIQRIFCCF